MIFTRKSTPPPATPSPNISMKNLHNATGPQHMTQLVVPRAPIRHSSGNAITLGQVLSIFFLDLKARFLDDVDFDSVAPGDTPGAAVLRGFEGAGGTGAGAGTADYVVCQNFPSGLDMHFEWACVSDPLGKELTVSMYNVTELCGGPGSLEEEVRMGAWFRGWKGKSGRCTGHPKDVQERAQFDEHGVKPSRCSHVAGCSAILVLHNLK